MKSIVCTFAASLLLCASQAGAIGHGWSGFAGFNYGFNYDSCNFANSLWEGYCDGGPCAPPSCCHPCGAGCHFGTGFHGCGPCGTAVECCAPVPGCDTSCNGGGCGGRLAGCCPSRPRHPGPWWYGYSTQPYTGCGCAGTCQVGHCGRCAGAGCGGGLAESLRNRMAFRGWVGGGPLDGCGLVPGYGFPGSQVNLGFADSFCPCQQPQGAAAPQPPSEAQPASSPPPAPPQDAAPQEAAAPEEMLPPSESFSGEDSFDQSFFN